jgi:ABC-type polysaccharide/polyol phosphate transport system ATPase subunit
MKCKTKIKEIAQNGRTVVFTSHDMDSVSRLCQEAVVLDHGHVVAKGDVENCIREYRRICGSP